MTSNPERPHTTNASLRRSTWSADVTSMKTTDSSEARLVRQIGIAMRAVVVLSWLSILVIWPLRQIPQSVAHGAFTFFRIIAGVATLWLIAEMAEAAAGRTSFSNVAIDALLTLPMFVFWLLVFVSSF
jgi:hypothetical protein